MNVVPQHVQIVLSIGPLELVEEAEQVEELTLDSHLLNTN
jgi:hypothetical protein